MRTYNRKTAPKVRGGKTQRKQNHRLTPSYWNTSGGELVVDQQRPGKGFKHYLKKRDLWSFIELIPNWEHISEGLRAVVLERGDFTGVDGYYYYLGVISLTAWPVEENIWVSPQFERGHSALFDRLGINRVVKEDGYVCYFSADQIRAYQLLHVFLHELGHHVDRMSTKAQQVCGRGEAFAEDFAWEWEAKIWHDYQEVFGVLM